MQAANHETTLQWIAELFGEPRDRITLQTSRSDIANWDSLGVLTLMAEVDERYHLTLTDKDVKALQTVGDLVRWLNDRNPSTAPGTKDA